MTTKKPTYKKVSAKKPVRKTAAKPTTSRKVTTKSPVKRRRAYKRLVESDGQYLFKLVVVLLLGTIWLRFNSPMQWMGTLFTAIPLGVFVGMILIHKLEKLQSDRKIWYAVLVIAGVIGNFLPTGIVI